MRPTHHAGCRHNCNGFSSGPWLERVATPTPCGLHDKQVIRIIHEPFVVRSTPKGWKWSFVWLCVCVCKDVRKHLKINEKCTASQEFHPPFLPEPTLPLWGSTKPWGSARGIAGISSAIGIPRGGGRAILVGVAGIAGDGPSLRPGEGEVIPG